jgi:hypothetical protein
MKWLAEVNSRTASPAWSGGSAGDGADTVTVAPGAAYDGLIASMVIERWPALRSAGLACAGAADASPAANC